MATLSNVEFKQILVPYDFSDMSKAALREADELAGLHKSTLTLAYAHPVTTVAVLDYTYAEPPEMVAKSLKAVEAKLRTVADDLRTPPERVKTLVLAGEAASSLVAASADYDLVLMATHGRTGIGRFLMGSIAERVVRGAACSVLIVRTPDSAPG